MTKLELAFQFFELSKTRYLTLQRAAAKLIVKEQWATGPLHETEPLEIAYAGLDRGTALSRTPARTNGKIGYGFDATGELIVIKSGTSFAGQFQEEFFEATDDGLKSICFGSTKLKELINIRWRTIDAGRVSNVVHVGKRGARTSEYIYEEGRVVAVKRREWRSLNDTSTNAFRTVVSYGAQGEVSQIVDEFPNGHQVIRYPG